MNRRTEVEGQRKDGSALPDRARHHRREGAGTLHRSTSSPATSPRGGGRTRSARSSSSRPSEVGRTQGRVPGPALPRAAHAALRHRGLGAHAAHGRARRGHARARHRDHRPQREAAEPAHRGHPRRVAHRGRQVPRRDALGGPGAGAGGRPRHRGPHGRGRGRSRSGARRPGARPAAHHRRPRPPAAGGLEPALQRDQVHARGRHGDGDAAPRTDESLRAHRCATPAPGSTPPSCPTSSSASARAAAPARGATAASGLGLSIVRHIVEMHGGTVEARERGPGPGVDLRGAPARRGRQRERRSRPSAGSRQDGMAAAPRLDGLRVLVVDDEAGRAQPDRRRPPGARGARVHGRVRRGGARPCCRRSARTFLLSDISMRDEDGYDLIRKVRGPARRRAAGGRRPRPSPPTAGWRTG